MHVKFKDPVTTPTSMNDLDDEISRHLIFDDGDDDLSIQVSILSDSLDPDYGLAKDILDVLQAYGFSEVVEHFQAPGSWFAKLKARFHSQNREAARRSKAELRKDLRSDRPLPLHTKGRAVGKLKKKIKQLKKKAGTIIVMGATLVGQAAYDASKDAVKEWIKKEIPRIEHKLNMEAPKAKQRIRGFLVLDLDPKDARELHRAVDRKIEESPLKEPIPLPPSSD